MTEIKKLTEADFDRFYQLYLASFNYHNNERRKKAFKIRFQNSHPYGAIDTGKLVGGLWALPFEVGLETTRYKMEGLGVVMTAKNYEGKGIASDLIKNAIREMKDRHVALSYLAPFSYPFYRKFGYEHVFNTTTYSVDSKDVPKGNSGSLLKYVKSMDYADAVPLIKENYDRIVTQARGNMFRPDWWWDYLGVRYTNRKVAIAYTADGEMTGFLDYEIIDRKLHIFEWVNDLDYPDSFLKLLNYMVEVSKDIREINCAIRTAYYIGDALADPSILTTQIKPYMMARIVDLDDFMSRYPYESTFSNIVFNLTDPVLAENNGSFSISYDGSTANFKKLSEKNSPEADFEISIQQLTKLMMGGIQVEYAIRLGKITKLTDRADGFMDAMITGQPELYDYF